jgi:hypothetical protein
MYSCTNRTKIIQDNVELIDGKSIADALNDLFANIGNKLANFIPPVTKSLLTYLPLRKLSLSSTSYI